MKFRSKKLRAIFVMILLVLGWWIYKIYERHSDINDFFRNPADLAWAANYLDKRINFCDSPWQETRIRNTDDGEQYFSPSGRFGVKIYANLEEEESFNLTDTKVGTTLLSFSFPWDPKGAALGHDDFKWEKGDRFLIFRKPIAMDSDWAISRVYVSDTENGKVLYLGDSAFYECVMRNW